MPSVGECLGERWGLLVSRTVAAMRGSAAISSSGSVDVRRVRNWLITVSDMDTPAAPRPSSDPMGQLQLAILRLEKTTRRQTKAMIVLTWTLAFLILVLAGSTAIIWGM